MMTPDELAKLCMSKIDMVALRQTHQCFRNTTWEKFFHVPEFVAAAANHAVRLDAELMAGSRVLDLGCGFGYVAFALEMLGHKCCAWDAPAQVLKNVANAIPVSGRVFRQIEPGKSLRPELFGNFDLIILHGVFPMAGPAGYWQWDDYAGLAAELIDTLNPGGVLEILVNRGDELEKICNGAAWDMLVRGAGEDFSATIVDNCITVRRMGAAISV